MPNTTTYNPAGYADISVEGDQSYTSFVGIKADADVIFDQLGQAGKPRLALIDLTKQGKFTTDSNRAAMEMLEATNYDRVAIFGANKILEEVTKGIILAMGKGDKTRIFSDRESALAWLQPAV
jgi:hypothetical protein